MIYTARGNKWDNIYSLKKKSGLIKTVIYALESFRN